MILISKCINTYQYNIYVCVCVCIDIWMIYSDTTNTNLTYITKSTRYITFDKYVILR